MNLNIIKIKQKRKLRKTNSIKYNNSIDFFKGTLIISVFLGHLITGNINNTFIRYFIYSFHMPLFIEVISFYILYVILSRIFLRKGDKNV